MYEWWNDFFTDKETFAFTLFVLPFAVIFVAIPIVAFWMAFNDVGPVYPRYPLTPPPPRPPHKFHNDSDLIV